MVTTGPLAPAEVAALIAGGEDSFCEFKSAATSNRDLAKELCAFLNAGGGRVLIGVEDDKTLSGLGTWSEERVMDVARSSLDPAPVPQWQVVELSGVRVAVVSVDQGTEKPYAVGGGEGKQYYMRVGSTSRPATREELIRLTQASGAVQADLRPVPGSTIGDLDEAALEWRFGNRRTVGWSGLDEAARARVLTSAEILHTNESLTVGGLVCFGAAPLSRLPHAEVVCAAYGGSVVARELVDRGRAGGRVEQQVDVAADFVRRNMRVGSTVEGVHRVEEPRPSDLVIREVIANAVAHRDYSIGAPVQLRVFTDRLEVLSPGALPNGMTPEAMRLGASVRRNPFIVQYLAERGVVDALGRGILLATEESLERGLPQPGIDVGEGFVQVTVGW
jgi:ATP-dependent DNA helicase RecG